MANFEVENITDLSSLEKANMNEIAHVKNGNYYYKLCGTNPADLHSWKKQLDYIDTNISNVKMNVESNLKYNSNKLDIEDGKY